MRLKVFLSTVVLGTSLSFSSANASVTTFEPNPNVPVIGNPNGLGHSSFTFDGYNFSTTDGHPTITISSGNYDNSPFAYNGTNYLVAPGAITITKSNGGAFTLNSIDLANYSDSLYPNITRGFAFIASWGAGSNLYPWYASDPSLQYPNGGKMMGVTPVSDFGTYTFPSSFRVSNTTTAPFTNYTSLTIMALQQPGALGSGSAQFAMDNVNITAAVPEPETYAMLLAGLGLIGAAVKRRKAKQS